jgi:hypothetical protein
MDEHESVLPNSSEPPDDLKARLRLPDGRLVYRDGQGRHYALGSGQFVPEAEAAGAEPAPPENLFSGSDLPSLHVSQSAVPGVFTDAARRGLLAAVEGAETAEEAWARIVAVQAEIALDPEAGARATAAAKMVAQATGMLPPAGGVGDRQPPPDRALDIVADEALQVLVFLFRQQNDRLSAPEAGSETRNA